MSHEDLFGATNCNAELLLDDGTSFKGISFGAGVSVAGEAVFQTGMVGYPESLTDPSYQGQILVLTYPLVGNYGVFSEQEKDANGLPLFFESSKIHITALVIGNYCAEYSHWRAIKSLSAWLKEHNIPAIHGVDTRALTKKIRTKGVLLAKLRILADPKVEELQWNDPNVRNLVAEVSTKQVKVFKPTPAKGVTVANPPLKIVAVDVGMKYNQIRCFTDRGAQVTIVPWNHDISKEDYDGLFISNGPGDPTMCVDTISHLRKALQGNKPIFGICLGHQLLSLAAGAKTKKMLFGNRGQNIPCVDQQSGRCYITSQNHGFAVDVSTLPSDWEALFMNANDQSNEGISHKTKPFFSVQFHPESFPGPRDTENLFDRFLNVVRDCKQLGKLVPLPRQEPIYHPRVKVSKVLILGSGGLSIGQAGEFDYSGSQAIKALKEEGIYTVLINPNIATIQTSKGLADKVYFLPVSPEFVRKVIKYERPDGIYVSFGGQTALNCGIQLKDEFESLGVKVLGTPIETVILTEDRELFAQAMLQINERCAKSASATTMEEAVAAAKDVGYPLIVRAAYALGGLGSGFCNNEQELQELCKKSFAVSPQVLIEKSLKGWKEIEYEVVRDINDNCITVCNMENFDPLGIHTGDSIVVAPSQTLSDRDFHRLRTTAINVIRHLGVVGECNIQYALDPHSDDYYIIEVNARLSRSSALASKATGYPLAFVAAKLGLHIPLTEIKNSVTKVTISCFEPSLDYVVVKIPRWDLKKFHRVSSKIASAMKSVGEVMAIGRTFEETIQKGIRAVDSSLHGFQQNACGLTEEGLSVPTDERLFVIANALHAGYTVDKLWKLTNIDKWFLNRLKHIVDLDKALSKHTASDLPSHMLKYAKQRGFSDHQVSRCINSSPLAVRKLRTDLGLMPFAKQIDTVSAEFPAKTNYLYLTYNAVEHDVTFEEKGVMVLGSGVYRIGSSVEFDWCAVRAIRTLRANNVKTIMVNYNPETVSTDYDEADRLYFENITLETVTDIYTLESSSGVMVAMGGQTPNNIALGLHHLRLKILGTSPEMIDNAENRYKFSRMLDAIGVDQPSWKELSSYSDSEKFCEQVGYPVLVRPSYVLSGAAMNVVHSKDDLSSYLNQATSVSPDHPVVISKFIMEAKEIEMDAVAKKGELIMHVITEHVENAGVHSGDATLVLPPQDLDPETVKKIEDATRKIAYALNVTGPFNIQFIAKNNQIKVIECNLRAARSFPFVSKVIGVDLIELATKAMMDLPFQPYPPVQVDFVAVKVPQFSFSRLSGADPILGVEMASTGEVACFGKDKYEAYIKALLATAFTLPKKNILLSIGSFKEKHEFLPSARKLHTMGFKLFATPGTADFLTEHSIPVTFLDALDSAHPSKREYSLTDALASKSIDLYINLPSMNHYRRPASYMSRGYVTRRMAVDFSVPLITNIKCAKLFVEALSRKTDFPIRTHDFQTSATAAVIPGFVDLAASVTPFTGEAISQLGSKALAGGVTLLCVNSDSAMPFAAAHEVLKNSSPCDFTMFVTPSQVDFQGPMTSAAGLFLSLPSSALSLGNLSNVFEEWPENRALVAKASGAHLATVLFFASLSNRAIHISQVSTKQDLQLIIASKERGIQITCDVSVFSLFFTKQDFPHADLGTKEDMEALWTNIDHVDCFSSGDVARQISKAEKANQTGRLEDMLPLLLTAVSQSRIPLKALIQKIHDNPLKVLGLASHSNTFVTVEVDRERAATLRSTPTKTDHSLLVNLRGLVTRVVVRDQTLYLDGHILASSGAGKEIVRDFVQASEPLGPRVKRRKTSIVSDSQDAPHPLPVIPSATAPTPTPTPMDVNSPPRKSSIDGDITLDQRIKAARKPTLTTSGFFMQHITSVDKFTRVDLHSIFGVAQEMKNLIERDSSIDLLRGKILCNLFYEPSTRTSGSFEAAMKRLGGDVVLVNQTGSSIAKGESLPDTIRTLDKYADVIVIRHPGVGSAQEASKFSGIPVINAGDGIGEHPTQALLDIYTIREELGTVNGLDIALVGDLKHGRTTHSLVKLLTLYNVRLHYVSPQSLRMPKEIMDKVSQAGIAQKEYNSLEEVAPFVDVLYMTRIQKERFENEQAYLAVSKPYVVNPALMNRMKPNMIVLHPLPRIDEIEKEVDLDPRAAYFRQMRHGLHVRMALLLLILGKV